MKKLCSQGFTLLATLFILIILAMAGVYLIKIGLTQLQIVNFTLLSSRAQFALESALKLHEQIWKTSQTCKESTYQFNKDAKSLAGYEVKITCLQSYQYPVQNPTFIALQLNARAQHGDLGDRDYVNYQRTTWFVLDKTKSISDQALK